jgi:hypothetical protein
MPFDQYPFPCCCCSNRHKEAPWNCWACFHLCGGLNGSPSHFSSLYPQPRDPGAFVTAYYKVHGLKPPGRITTMNQSLVGKAKSGKFTDRE